MTLTQRPPSPDDVGYDSDKEYEISSAPALTTSFALQKDPARQAFDEIINDAQQGKLMLATGAYRKSFTEKYREHLNARVTPENQTLLHLVANQVGHLPLSLYLVRHHSHLLQTTDDSNKTPLYIAIVRRNFNVLKAILDKFTGDLDKLLAVTCDHGRNSIHAAIYYDLDENYTLSFIKKASEETLCARDHDGLTPLHLAVHYNRCSKSQLGIVQALIARGDRALDEFSINPPKLSVFEYHQHTRKEAEQPRANPETGPGSEPTNNSTPGLGINPAARNKKQREPGTPTNHDDESMAEMAPVHPTNAHSLDKFPHSLPNDDANVEGPAGLEQGNEGAHNGRGTGAGAEVVNRKFSVSEQGPHKAPTRKRLEEDRVKGEWADKTCQEIKLYYLRSTFQSAARPYPRDQNQALRFLHGANIQDLNLCFDYSKAPTPVHQSSFEQSFLHMHFDSVLRYVAFHKVELQTPPARNTGVQAKKLASQPKPGRGRKDLPFFFKWLREKDVKHIIKVIVDDSPERPHSDKAIEESLKDFKVESLEWRKFDICPETLFTACRDARNLSLWWSGNRATLRAWSESEGLAKLEKLETVHLLWNSGEVLESADVIQSYVEGFRARLTKSVRNFEIAKRERAGIASQTTKAVARTNTGENLYHTETPMRTITVEAMEENVPRGNQNNASGARAKPLSTTNQRNLSSHKWLICMDEFADEIQNVHFSPPKQKDLQKEITVALIDDGVNLDTPTVAGKVIGGETFDRGDPDENGPSPYFISSSGHGTVMADMICRVCPTAKLYVFKLETYLNQDPLAESQTHNQIVARSAALAVEAAVARSVDVISISWTVKKPKGGNQDEGLRLLGEAIKRALDENILIFCAAGDAGNFSDEEYPYEFDRGRIIRIGAATDDGRPWERSGNADNLDFIFPGCAVVSRNARLEVAVPSNFEEKTGSSVATALAAGMAALILCCVRLAAILMENDAQERPSAGAPVQAAALTSIKDYANMVAIFKSIGVDQNLHKFIEVWNRFEAPTESLRLSRANASEVVVNLAVGLLSSRRYVKQQDMGSYHRLDDPSA